MDKKSGGWRSKGDFMFLWLSLSYCSLVFVVVVVVVDARILCHCTPDFWRKSGCF